MGTVTRGGGLALSVVKKVPRPLVLAPNKLGRLALGADTLPLYSKELPAGRSSRKRPWPVAPAQVVYFPACVQTMFGPAAESTPGVRLSFEQLCERVGITLLVPSDIDGLCCGTPWSSKGFTVGETTMRGTTVAALRAATNDGELPIVCDASSCTEGLLQTIRAEAGEPRLRVIDAVQLAADQILPRLPEYRKIDSLASHPTGSSTRMGITASLHAIAGGGETVQVPENWGCCGFAGDRGCCIRS